MFISTGVFQDRFVKALRLQQINTLESANTYLEEEFLDELNARLHITMRSPSNLHRPVPRVLTLDHVLCYQEQRVVQNDGTVSWCNRICPLGVAHQKLPLIRQKILVSELLDGTMRLTWKGRPLSLTEVRTRPSKAQTKPTTRATTKAPHQPATTHPRRRRAHQNENVTFPSWRTL